MRKVVPSPNNAAKGNFKTNQGKQYKLLVTEDYAICIRMGYEEKSD
jgi:hypothetical protein